MVASAGSLIIFTEALLHGTLPWTAAHERRSMLYKFAPGPITYGNIAQDQVADNMEAAIGASLTPQQRALLLGPHSAGPRPSHVALAEEAARL